jgi:hypothetical protein
MPWFARFADPISISGRRPLRTLAEARGYILALPEAEREQIEWRTAWGILFQAATDGEPYVSMAHLAVKRALRRKTHLSSLG